MADVKKFDITRSDLDFILEQLLIAEQHAASNIALNLLVADPFLPFGLRLVDGSYNNLLPGQELFGAADQPFPRLLVPVWRDADVATFDPPGPQSEGQATSYAQTSGWVFDAEPRMISNLIVDQTAGNAAAAAAAGYSSTDPEETLFIPNVRADAGLSAPLNSWFTLFGQFFDHGLDLTNKGGSGLVFIPLATDDPLYNPGADGIAGTDDDPNTNFMVLTRATNLPGEDGILGNADDVHEHTNQTTSFVDQNQTYTSHPSHQAFLREYAFDTDGNPVSTGRLIEGRGAGSDGIYFAGGDDATYGGLATWAVVKASAAHFLGIWLTDADVTNVPMVLTDQYGKFIPGVNGYAQLMTSAGLVEGDPAANGGRGISTANAIRTGHAFLDDIANGAAPRTSMGAMLTADGDAVAGGTVAPGTYDNELLDAHYITGDGRGNENIGLTSVHHVFHSEHNRVVEEIKETLYASGDYGAWLIDPTQTGPIESLVWNGERLFQAAKFSTEMQYQHLVFEEFARTVQPNVNLFGDYVTDQDPSIFAEFAHVVYRFGHTMLTETMSITNADGTVADTGLIDAFLNPLLYASTGTSSEAAGAIVRGMTNQVANEIDEFITEALRNNLLGLPLDLATINIARGRDTGMPSLNGARREFYEGTQDSALAPYESWADFGFNLKNPESLVNFIAAYGTHASITDALTLDAKRAAAEVLLGDDDFMWSTGAYANDTDGRTTTGLDDVDFWIGGLAEKQMPFGGILGSTFGFVFEEQMERLQDADRFYYLARTEGLNFLTQLEESSFAELIMRNTDTVHLHFNVFFTPDATIEVDDPGTWPTGEVIDLPGDSLRYIGTGHVVLGGNENANRLISGEGDDALWGDGGDDSLDGGAGNDAMIGGEGNDTLTDTFGDDVLKGGEGDDWISGGKGLDLILGGLGNDTITNTDDDKEVFAGGGNDVMFGGEGSEGVNGGGGDDWLEGRGSDDGMNGDDGAPLEGPALNGIPSIDNGDDVLIGGSGGDRMTGEGGDDIFVGGEGQDRHFGDLGFDWITYERDIRGIDASLLRDALVGAPLPPSFEAFLDRFRDIEGLSGSAFDDTLRGDDVLASTLMDLNRITGLSSLLGAGNFAGGNIILGGAGSDTIEGRGGDDFIDGDAMLGVRLVTTNGASVIVREIVVPNGGAATDVAVFTEASSAYVVTRNADGTVTVAHRNQGIDGTDTLQNIEVVRFANRDLVLNAANVAATGAPTLDDTTPTQEQAVEAVTSGIVDGNGLADAIFSFQWQSFDGTDWSDVAGATAQRFTPDQAEVGSLLRVVVSFVDDAGYLEQVTSEGFGVGAFFSGGAGGDNPTLSVFGDLARGDGGNDLLDGLAGDDELDGGGGSDTMIGGEGADTFVGGSGMDAVTYEASGNGVVVSLFTGGSTGEAAGDVFNSVEHLTGSGTGSDNLTGNNAGNRLEGLAGNDTLSGASGRDTLIGGMGADTLSGGLRVDAFQWLAFAESGATAGTADVVTDFQVGARRDSLDLSMIDPLGDADGAFSFVGTGAFRAGGFASVRYAQQGGNTFVELDQGDGGAAEMVIRLNGLLSLQSVDFML